MDSILYMNINNQVFCLDASHKEETHTKHLLNYSTQCRSGFFFLSLLSKGKILHPKKINTSI